MKPKKYVKIKEEYDDYYRSLLKKGQLPLRSTELGFWNAAISDEIYEAFKMLGLRRFDNFIDLGSGDGKVTLIASLFCRNSEGVEIDDELHEKALEAQKKLKIRNARFHHDDFNHHSIKDYDVVFINPDTPMERGTEEKLLREMNGKLIVHSNHFHPMHLKKEGSFRVDNTLFSVYSR